MTFLNWLEVRHIVLRLVLPLDLRSEQIQVFFQWLWYSITNSTAPCRGYQVLLLLNSLSTASISILSDRAPLSWPMCSILILHLRLPLINQAEMVGSRHLFVNAYWGSHGGRSTGGAVARPMDEVPPLSWNLEFSAELEGKGQLTSVLQKVLFPSSGK